MIYVTEVCSNQFIGYMIALQSPYMIALQSPLSSHNWSRYRWQFIDVQRSRFLELKVNNSFIHSIRLISLEGCAIYFNIIFSIYLRYFGRKTNCDLWVLMRFSVKVVSLHKHGWFATSHARILEHRERRLEIGLCSCTI